LEPFVVPEGYLPFKFITRTIISRRDAWVLKLPPGWERYRTNDWNWLEQDVVVQNQVLAFLGPKLAGATVRAAGFVVSDGRLFWAPPEAWSRIGSEEPDGPSVNTVHLALGGHIIGFPVSDLLIPCFPVISERELALAFNAGSPPSTPSREPMDLIAPYPGHEPVTDPLSVLDSPPAPQLAAQVPRVQNRGGKPPRHDWLLFLMEVAWWAAANDLHSHEAHREDLQRHMVEWCDREWRDDAPDDSTIRKKLQDLYAYGRRRDEKAKHNVEPR
jgi:hypothetical protein